MSIYSQLRGLVFGNLPSSTPSIGQEIDPSFDKMGRLINYPYSVRDLVSTASVTLTRGNETSILAGVAGEKHDLLWVHATNTSTAADFPIIFRSGTGGSEIFRVTAGASGSRLNQPFTFPIPLPGEVGSDWTAQAVITGEVSDSPVLVSLLAIKNI